MNSEPRKEDTQERAAYEAPAIIYEGEITTRAGSELPNDPPGVDPSELFSDG